MFSQAKGVKMSVLSTRRSKNLINAVEKLLFCSTSCTFTENPCAKMRKTQKSDKTIMFYMKNCKNDALLVKNLQRECFFNPRNPRGTLFRTGRPLGSNTPLYYLAYENPYSCAVGEQKKKKNKLKK